MKTKTKAQQTKDSREYRLLMREEKTSCSRCKPHRGENASRKSKHPSKPKKKDKR